MGTKHERKRAEESRKTAHRQDVTRTRKKERDSTHAVSRKKVRKLVEQNGGYSGPGLSTGVVAILPPGSRRARGKNVSGSGADATGTHSRIKEA